MTQGKYITVWRKPAPDFLEWDFHVSFHDDELPHVVRNLEKQGVRQFSTYPLSERMAEFSKDL